MRLEKEKADLEKQVMKLQSHADQIKRRSNEQTLAEEKKHAEEIEQLKKTNQQLKVFCINVSLHNRKSFYKPST